MSAEDDECWWCHGKPLPIIEGPNGRLLRGRCGVCSPLPPSVLAELDEDPSDEADG